MLKFAHGLLEFPIEPIFTPPTCSGLRGRVYKFHQQGCFTRRHHYAFSIRGDPFWKKNAGRDNQCIDPNWKSLFP